VARWMESVGWMAAGTTAIILAITWDGREQMRELLGFVRISSEISAPLYDRYF
jgi:hypothetical protein